MTYRIKPLVWEESHLSQDYLTADTGFGIVYRISAHRGAGSVIWWLGHAAKGEDCANIPDAKAAVQSDYEARIRAPLEPADPLADAMKLSGIKALVNAANTIVGPYSSQEYGPTIYNIENLRTALASLIIAPLTRDQQIELMVNADARHAIRARANGALTKEGE